MPIEIKEIVIKVKVRTDESRSAPTGDEDAFRFGDAAIVPEGPDVLACLPPDDLPGDALAKGHHSGGLNMNLGDGSVRALAEGFDLFA